MITCHAKRRLIVYFSKDDDGMPRSKSFDRVYIPRAMMALPRPMSSYRVYCLMAIMVCHARWSQIMFCYPRAIMACHAWYCLIRFCYPRAMMAYHAWRSLIVCAVKGDDVIYAQRRATMCAKLGEIYNWMGQKAFYHKIDYITSKFTFSNVLPRYSELKNLLSIIRFVAINNYNYLKYYGKFKI